MKSENGRRKAVCKAADNATMQLIVAKNAGGPKGVVQLAWDERYGRFDSIPKTTPTSESSD